jgi:hypothetical protein
MVNLLVPMSTQSRQIITSHTDRQIARRRDGIYMQGAMMPASGMTYKLVRLHVQLKVIYIVCQLEVQ